MIDVFSFSEPGGHIENEDAHAVRLFQSDPEIYLCAVADGQGGQPGGGAAARVARTTCIDAASKFAAVSLCVPKTWNQILQTVDRAVADEPTAGFTTLAAFCLTAEHIYGASCGDSAVVSLRAQEIPTILTAQQCKNPPIGSGFASAVSFSARLRAPWTVLAMSDGVWKYAGWENLFKVAAGRSRGEEICTALRECAQLPRTGALQDDFTLVVLQLR
jgi:hypothetical protein